MFRSIVLLSGGLDSLVSIAVAKQDYNIQLALTFDYGQKSLEREIIASQNISKYYGLEHKVIKLDWLKEITQTALVSDDEVPTVSNEDLNSQEKTKETAKSVWVPNRNGLFVNIAASFADSYGYDYIIIGANAEEAQTFPDNSKEFIERETESFKYSTQAKPKVYAPLIDLTKGEIVKKAIIECAPLELVRSCYSQKVKHCGLCESCKRLKRALIENDCTEIMEALFGE